MLLAILLLGPLHAAASFILIGRTQHVVHTLASYPGDGLRVGVFQDASASVPLVGETVTFSVQGSCGAFRFGQGGYTTQVTVVSGAFGEAVPPEFIGNLPGQCDIAVSIPGYGTAFHMTTYQAQDLSVTLSRASPLTVYSGQQFDLNMRILFRGMPIEYMRGSFRSAINPQGPGLASYSFSGDSDANGEIRGTFYTSPGAGTFTIDVNVADVINIPFVVNVRPGSGPNRTLAATSPAGGEVRLAIAGSPPADCSFREDAALLNPQRDPLPEGGRPPETLVFPEGVASIRTVGCGAGQPVTFTLTTPRALPAGSAFWIYGPTPERRERHWHSIPLAINGETATFQLFDGGLGDDDDANDMIQAYGGFGTGSVAESHQDLWWGGAIENGWGTSIVQHGDTLFAVIYAYDAAGAPTWYVMSGGSWNAAHTRYTGALYAPRGSPHFAYDASRFVVGASVGTLSLTFAPAGDAVLDYQIRGVTGSKSISRQRFGPAAVPPMARRGDMWWGGASQNGWGIAILQQGATLFSAWFTYDAQGAPTWFVMPSGTWSAGDTYEGRLYRTQGSPWLGVPYDASRLQVIDVGAYRFRFTEDTAVFDYTVEGRTGSMPLTRQPF